MWNVFSVFKIYNDGIILGSFESGGEVVLGKVGKEFRVAWSCKEAGVWFYI